MSGCAKNVNIYVDSLSLENYSEKGSLLTRRMFWRWCWWSNYVHSIADSKDHLKQVHTYTGYFPFLAMPLSNAPYKYCFTSDLCICTYSLYKEEREMFRGAPWCDILCWKCHELLQKYSYIVGFYEFQNVLERDPWPFPVLSLSGIFLCILDMKKWLEYIHTCVYVYMCHKLQDPLHRYNTLPTLP